MIVFTEKIAPPPTIPEIDDEATQNMAAKLVQDQRWVQNIIAGLAGILRDVKH